MTTCGVLKGREAALSPQRRVSLEVKTESTGDIDTMDMETGVWRV